MASSKYKGFYRKKLNLELRLVVSSLRKENSHLKKTLAEMTRQHSEHNKLVEKFLSLVTVKLESCQQPAAKSENMVLVSEQPRKNERQCRDMAALTVDFPTNEQASNNIRELQKRLTDALEKNKQWLEYDQQREVYVRALLARMLGLETQLNEAKQALSQQHKGDNSDEKERLNQMQEHYERLLQLTRGEVEMLREQVSMAHQILTVTQKWCKERQVEVEELKQQLDNERNSRKMEEDDQFSPEDEDQWLRDETKELQRRLDEEKRRSAVLEQQARFCQQFLENRHQAGEEQITVLERQREQQDHDLREGAHSSGEVALASPHSSQLNESFLECPNCQTEYPASHYRQLMNHLETCVD
ncbi:uncharacterized protein V6R79_006954 [Siganus canaliculatus]